MYRIGIVGSDNSHADAFSMMMNNPDPITGEFKYPDFKCVAIYGPDPIRTKEVATKGNIPTIVDDPAKMIGMVDAVMVVFRHGDLHMPYALPFIEAGIPTWIDKPFCIKNDDAIKLIEASKKYNTIISGGSTLRYLPDVQIAKYCVENGSRIGEVQSAVLNYAVSPVNEYGGFYFYSHHLVEMCLSIFGYAPVSIVATENNGNVTAIVKYPKINITLNFLAGAPEHMLIINGSKGTMIRELDNPIAPYFGGFEDYIKVLTEKKMTMKYSQLYSTVAVINAIKTSYETGKEITLEYPEI